MKTAIDIIEREPINPGEPAKPGISGIISLATLIYFFYLIDKGFRLSTVDLVLIPVSIYAVGSQVYLFLKKNKKKEH